MKDTEILLPLYEPSPQVCTAPATPATAGMSSCIVCLSLRIHVLGFGIPSALYFACKQVCRQIVACSSALASKHPLPCLPLDPPQSTPFIVAWLSGDVGGGSLWSGHTSRPHRESGMHAL